MKNLDDLPVGQHQKLDIPEQPAISEVQPAQDKSLPLTERLVHKKNPKIRFEAFSELVKLLQDAASDSPVFAEYLPSFGKYLSDSHPGAQEKALEAFQILLTKYPMACTKDLSESIAALLEKGFTAAKATARGKASDCLLIMAESKEQFKGIFDTICKNLESASVPPKVHTGCLQALIQILNNFGHVMCPLGPTLPSVIKLANSTNFAIRQEAMNYFVEAYRWDKDEISSKLASLRTAQQDELKGRFAEVKPADKPPKEIKGANVKDLEMQLKKKKEEEKAALEKKQEEAMMTEDEEKAVLSKFGEKWCTQLLEIKKWKEKKDKLDELSEALNVKKLKVEGFAELGSTLKKLLGDSNIMVVNAAMKIIGQLAVGLKGHFGSYCKAVFGIILQKCKDRKTTPEAKKCLACFVGALKMDDITEDIKEALLDKSPLVKFHICTWLENSVLPKVPIASAKSLNSSIFQQLIKLTDDASSDVRDAALTCLGVMKVIVHDYSLNKVLQELNLQKQEKIMKAAEGVLGGKKEEVEKMDEGEKTREEGKMESDGTSQLKPDMENAKKRSATPTPMISHQQKEDEKPIAVAGIEKAIAVEKPALEDSKPQPMEVGNPLPQEEVKVKKPPAAKKEPRPKTAKEGGNANKQKEIAVHEDDLGPEPEEEETKTKIGSLIPQEVLAQFDNADWKERQKGYQMINEWIQKNKEGTQSNILHLTYFVKLKLKDFKENNQGILKEAFSLINAIAINFNLSKQSARALVTGICEKLSDTKLQETCSEILFNIADSATPTFVANQLLKVAIPAKSLPLIKGSLSLFIKMINEYTTSLLPVKTILDYAKQSLNHSNPQVRNASTSLIASLYAFVGDPLKALLAQNIKEATLKTVEAELEKTEKKSTKDANEIKRKLRGESEQEASAKAKAATSAADALIPRLNIAPQLTTKLIANLTDSGMKVRQEARETIEKILAASNQRIQPNGLGPLFNALKSRMNEPCKNLAKNFITSVGNLAVAIGPPFKQYSKTIMQPLMYNLADKQGYIRTETLAAMNKIADAAGAEMIINNLSSLLEKDNPEMRQELLSWILKHKDALGKSDPALLVPGLVCCLQDRGREIRNLAEELSTDIMNRVGFQVFANAIQDLKPMIKNSLKGILEKLKQSMTEPMQVQAKKQEAEPMVDTVAHVEEAKGGVVAGSVVAAMPLGPDLGKQSASMMAPAVPMQTTASTTAAEPLKTTGNAIDPAPPHDSVIQPIAPVSSLAQTQQISSVLAQPASTQLSPMKALPEAEEAPVSTKKPGTITKAKNTTILNAKKKSTLKVLSHPPPEATLASSRSTNDLAKAGDNSDASTKKSQGAHPPNMSRMCSQKTIMNATMKKQSAKGKALKDSPSKSQISSSTIGGNASMEAIVVQQISLSKEKRAELDKGIKWPIDEIRDNLVEKLKKSLCQVLNPALFEMMFAPQFKKNLEAVKLLSEGLRSDFIAMVDILDLLLKYIAIKMVDQSNTAINKAILEFLRILFTKLSEMSYAMLDYEAAVIVPMLCERTGVSNAGFKEDIKNLIALVSKIYSPIKLASFVIKSFESKNQKTKIECLILMREMIAEHGMKLITQKDIKIFSKFLTFGDQTIRNEAISVLEEIYKRKGETIWTYLNEVSEKNKEMLKQKFKYIDIISHEGTTPTHCEPMKEDDCEEKKEGSATTDKLRKSMKTVSLENQQMECNKTDILSAGLSLAPEREPDNAPTSAPPMQSVAPVTQGQLAKMETAPVNGVPCPNPVADKLPLSSTVNPPHSACVLSHPPAPSLPGDSSPQSISPLKPSALGTPKVDTLEGILEFLKRGDMSKRVDALVSLNNMTTTQFEQHKETLKSHCDQITETFAEVLQTIFEGKTPQEIPIRFGKFFMSAINKMCSLKYVVKDCSLKAMSLLMSQLLQILIYEELDKLGENNEGQSILKSLNNTMLRLMENCDPTNVFCCLLDLFKTYRKAVPPTAGAPATMNLTKIPALIIKCLLKMSRVMELLLPSLDIARVLLSIHEYLLVYPSNPQSKTPNDEIGTRMVKTLINELVKLKRESIWEYYHLVQKHEHPDTHINRWISVILRSFNPVSHTPTRAPATPGVQQPPASAVVPATQPKESPDELKEIFKGLNSQATFYEAIKSLSDYLDRHPQLDVTQYFSSCSKAFTDYVMSSIQKYRSQQKQGPALVESTNTPNKIPGNPPTSFFTTSKKSVTDAEAAAISGPGSMIDYKNRIESLRQKFGMISSRESGVPGTEGGSAGMEILNKIDQLKAILQKPPGRTSGVDKATEKKEGQ